jgi:gamma-glutamyltranspeptidase/glutathione hydrolase
MTRWKGAAAVIGLGAFGLLAFTASPPWDRPAQGGEWMVSSGHRLATEAGLATLERGGNAFDAAVAVCMALNVTRPISAGAVGVTPTLIWDAASGRARGYSGLGPAPAKASVDYYRMQGWPITPPLGVNSQLVPAGPDTWIALLTEYGTVSFAEAAEPAIRLAEDGHVLNRTCAKLMQRMFPPVK